MLKSVHISCGMSFIKIHRRMLQKEMPMLPKLQLPISDVRDVAAAHIKCLTLPGVPGMYVII